MQPQTGLVDGQVVKASFGGLNPGDGIDFRQCVANPKTIATDCTAVSPVTGIAGALGAGVAFIQAQAGTQIPASAGGSATLICDFTHPCVMAAMTDTNSLTTAAFAPLTFAISREDCPAFPNDGLIGGGESSAFRAVYSWEFNVCKTPDAGTMPSPTSPNPALGLGVDYTNTSSSQGEFFFGAGTADFAVTGPLGQPPPTTGPTFRLAPITMSALVVAYRMDDHSGALVTNLVLTPDLIAQIFEGAIPNPAQDPRIGALNPGVTMPGRLQAFARADDSAETYVFSSWLAATAPTSWTAGALSTFPAATGIPSLKSGGQAVALAMIDPSVDPTLQANFAVMDSSTAAFYGLQTVKIKQADGSLVEASGDDMTAVAHAVADTKVNADGTLSPDYSHPNPDDYPMVMPEYMLVPTNATGRIAKQCDASVSAAACAQKRGAQLASFLRYAVQGGQGVLPAGYTPLLPSLSALSLEAAAAIPAPPPPSPSPSPTSTPSPAHTPTPAPRSTSTALALAPVVAPAAAPTLPTLAPAPTAAPSPSAAAAAPVATAAPIPRVTPTTLDFAQLADSPGARYAVPVCVALAGLGLAGGLALEALVRRPRWLFGSLGGPP